MLFATKENAKFTPVQMRAVDDPFKGKMTWTTGGPIAQVDLQLR